MICIKELDLESLNVNTFRPGRKRSIQAEAGSGRFVRAVPVAEGENYFDIAPGATLRAALLRGGTSSGSTDFLVTRDDFRKKVYKRPQKTLILFVVDSSDSMGEGTYARIKAAKGAVLAILTRAYQKRHRVGMVSFRDETAEVVLQPTSSLTLARRKLKALPTGGATPFGDGLMKAWKMVKTERIKDPKIRPLIVVLSDGEANVPFDGRTRLPDVMDELLLIGAGIRNDNISSILIDTRPLIKPSDNMLRLSEAMGGVYHHISRLRAEGMVRAVVEF